VLDSDFRPPAQSISNHLRGLHHQRFGFDLELPLSADLRLSRLIFEGSIVARLLRGQPLASYSFKHYPVPYSGTVAILGLLDLILAPEISGKLVLSLCVILLALSSIYLLRSLRRDADNPILLIPLFSC